jgi:hypothetical protein
MSEWHDNVGNKHGIVYFPRVNLMLGGKRQTHESGLKDYRCP